MEQGKASKKIFTMPHILLLIGAGFIAGEALAILSNSGFQATSEETAAERVMESATPQLSSKNINECIALCYQPPEKGESLISKPIVVKTAARSSGVTRLADLPKKIKNPNSIRISLAEAPTILAKVKMVNGRPTCAKKNDKGSRSNKYDYVHIDRECCLDPDEIPNPRCLYR